MKLEYQVISLELAKQMKDKGFKQESLWYWVWFEPMSTDVKYFPESHGVNDDWELKPRPKSRWSGDAISAYTVAELGKMLPCFRHDNWWTMKDSDNKILFSLHGRHDICKHYESSNTEANARAKMLLHLKEKDVI